MYTIQKYGYKDDDLERVAGGPEHRRCGRAGAARCDLAWRIAGWPAAPAGRPGRAVWRQPDSDPRSAAAAQRGRAGDAFTQPQCCVAALSADEVQEIYDIRIGLETTALRLAIPHLSPAILGRAADTLSAIDREADPARWSELNWAFHASLYTPAQRPRLLSLIKTMHDNVNRYLRIYLALMNFQDRSQQEHRALLAACERYDTPQPPKRWCGISKGPARYSSHIYAKSERQPDRVPLDLIFSDLLPAGQKSGRINHLLPYRVMRVTRRHCYERDTAPAATLEVHDPADPRAGQGADRRIPVGAGDGRACAGRRAAQRGVARPALHQSAGARGADQPDRPRPAGVGDRHARRRGPYRRGEPLVRRHPPHRRGRGAVRRTAQEGLPRQLRRPPADGQHARQHGGLSRADPAGRRDYDRRPAVRRALQQPL